MSEDFRHFEAYAEDGQLISQLKQVRLHIVLLRVLTLLVGTTAIVCEYGFYEHPLTGLLPETIISLPLRLFEVLVFVGYVVDIWMSDRIGRRTLPEGRRIFFDRFAHGLGLLAMLLAVTQLLPGAWHLFETVLAVLLLYELWILNVAISRQLSQPGVLLPLSFLMLIIFGSAMMMLPRAVPPGQSLSLIDAIFTITSAVCVTGLIVRDTATQFTTFGQIVICIFIQLGGLGIIIFGSMFAMLLGTKLSLQQNIGLKAMLNEQPLSRVTGMVRFIVLTTLGIELVGALLMMPMWPSEMPFGQRVGFSIFHAVSAFCNAGFSVNSDSLASYRYSPLTHGVVFWLIVLGGIGFPVLHNLWSAARWTVILRLPRLRRRYWDGLSREIQTSLLRDRRLSLSTKMVITTTATLYLGGAIVFAIGQFTPYMHQMLNTGVTAHRAQLEPLDLQSAGGILADSSFQSITARTAGFNSMPMDEVSPVGRFTLMALMLVGGSPGGTAGGVKTITFALVLLSIWATMRQRHESEAFGRQIADSLVRKAATLAACYIALIAAGILLLSISEVAPFVHIAFEVISATTTTGLSLGMTDSLSWFGKIVIILLMFLGRVGPLTLLGAVVIGVNRQRPYQYPHESVLIG